MKQSLNDIERTLLSAYMDGELSPEELAKAEELLASSEGARLYLSELTVVEHLSASVLAAVPVAGTAGVASVSAKLTGSAIQAAAKRSLLTKTASFGTWGLAGAVGAAVTGIVAVARSVNSPRATLSDVTTHPRAAAQAPMQAISSVDTSNLLVPPMSTSDMVAFAVHGTLPLDTGRQRFICLGTSGKDSLVVAVNDRPMKDTDAQLLAMRVTRAGALDSLQRIVRTSVLQSRNGIALRADIPLLRLNVLRSLEESVPTLPRELRRRLERTRDELATFVEFSRHGAQLEAVENPNVVYHLISFEGLTAIIEGDAPMGAPIFMSTDVANAPTIAVNGDMLRALELRVPIPPMPPPMMMAAEAEDGAPRVISNPSGDRFVAPRRTNSMPSRIPMYVRTQDVDAENQSDSSSGREVVVASGQHSGAAASENVLMENVTLPDTVRIRVNRALEYSRRALREADSLLKVLDLKIRRQIHLNTDGGEGDGSGDTRSTQPRNEENPR